ncbi:unnamed protein product [Rotaria sp. Silwood2]|nr:unnamed protein product [Rotaria sp. Silwood2]
MISGNESPEKQPINNHDDDASHYGSLLDSRKNRGRGFLDKGLFSTLRRNSGLIASHFSNYNNQMSSNEELIIIKNKIHNLKCEKKAFRTVGLILGALLICWLPFFVTLPLMSILKDHGILKDEKIANIWFKITFWLGYINSALNPFVYAFSNRAIRRGFREVIFRRFCCCICPKKSNQCNEQTVHRRRCIRSDSFTDSSQIASKRKNSYSVDTIRAIPKPEDNLETSCSKQVQSPNTNGPVVSFAEFLSDTDNDDISSHNNEQPNTAFIPTSTEKNSILNSNS